MPWSLPLYVEAIAIATAEEVSLVATPKKTRLCLKALKYLDVEVVEDSHESESEGEEDYSNNAFSVVDVVGSN